MANDRTGEGLRFVRLLVARADQVLNGLGGLFTLPLFKFCNPDGNSVDDIAGSLADSFRLIPFPVNAFSAFDNFYFFIGHKHK
jgi:hypothetical protein